MIKVRVKGEGVKLANKWCFINEEAIIDLEEYERNKEYVDIIEEIEEPKTDPEVLTSNEEASTGESQNPEGDNGENNESEDEELEALKERAKELGIKNTHNMKKETLIAKIQEIEEPKTDPEVLTSNEEASTGESQNPEGE